MYDLIEGPVTFVLAYTVPLQYGQETFSMDFIEQTWFLPASGHPYFNLSITSGNLVTLIQI